MCKPSKSDHSSWHEPNERLSAGEKPRMRATITKWYAEPLTSTNCNVHVKLARRPRNGESQQVCSTHSQCLVTHKLIYIKHLNLDQ